MGAFICRILGNVLPGGQAKQMRGVPQGPHGERAPHRRGSHATGCRPGRSRARGAEYLGVEDIAGNPAEHEQPVLLHGPGDTQPGHPLQGALVGLIVVTQAPAFLLGGLF